MENKDEEDKIVFKREYYEGGLDLSLNHYTQVQSIPIAVTRVTVPLYKKGRMSFIGTYEKLREGEIIQTGDYNINYRVVKFVLVKDEGNIYRVKRADNYNVTNLDIQGVHKGDKVKIKTRQEKHGMYSQP